AVQQSTAPPPAKPKTDRQGTNDKAVDDPGTTARSTTKGPLDPQPTSDSPAPPEKLGTREHPRVIPPAPDPPPRPRDVDDNRTPDDADSFQDVRRQLHPRTRSVS